MVGRPDQQHAVANVHEVQVAARPELRRLDHLDAAGGAAVWAGIGVNIQSEKDGGGAGWIFILDVYPESPAQAAGLRRFDRILEIEGRPLRNMTAPDASQLLRGQPGSTVSLVLQRGSRRLKPLFKAPTNP